jgi:hypothetical protein
VTNCLRGASAAQQLLERKADRKMRVLVVWEPILITDWRPPSGSALARISDGRVRQFWDRNHVVSGALAEIAKRKPPEAQPTCCVQKGFYWDEAILHPRGARWKDAVPSAFWNGPVVRVVPGPEKVLNDQP